MAFKTFIQGIEARPILPPIHTLDLPFLSRTELSNVQYDNYYNPITVSMYTVRMRSDTKKFPCSNRSQRLRRLLTGDMYLHLLHALASHATPHPHFLIVNPIRVLKPPIRSPSYAWSPAPSMMQTPSSSSDLKNILPTMSADKAKGRGSSLLDPLCNKCVTHNDLWLEEPEFIRTVLYVARDQKRITAHDGLLSSRLRASACESTMKTLFGHIITAMMS